MTIGQPVATTTHPFDTVKVRWLVLWQLMGLVPGIWMGIGAAIMHLEMKGCLELLVMTVSVVWPSLWVFWELSRVRVPVSELFGAPLRHSHWFRWSGLVVLLVLLSIGCGALTWVPISYVAPKLTEAVILKDGMLLTPEAMANPLLLGWRFTLLVVLVPIIEEIVFRGYIMQRWARKWGITAGLILSSVLFAVLHPEWVGHAMFGFVMGVLYIRTGSLWVPIFCHLLNNFIACVGEVVIHLLSGAERSTVAEFQQYGWWYAVPLVVVGPWAIWYLMRNWPRQDWELPVPVRVVRPPPDPLPPSLPRQA